MHFLRVKACDLSCERALYTTGILYASIRHNEIICGVVLCALFSSIIQKNVVRFFWGGSIFRNSNTTTGLESSRKLQGRRLFVKIKKSYDLTAMYQSKRGSVWGPLCTFLGGKPSSRYQNMERETIMFAIPQWTMPGSELYFLVRIFIGLFIWVEKKRILGQTLRCLFFLTAPNNYATFRKGLPGMFFFGVIWFP